jgi:iron(III) transport system ATP-binding protein
VRQRGVRVLPAGEGIPARRALDLRFLGDVALVEMAVEGLDASFFGSVRESGAPSVGSEISIDAGAVLAFAAENGNAPIGGAL